MGLFDRAASGDGAALARLATLLENDDSETIAALDALGRPGNQPHVVGITGPPGAGKSSLINLLLPLIAAQGSRVAVLLVDPSSRQTGGAVLGDRIRMQDRGNDLLFIRSQASRGQEGGLAPSTAALVDLFAHLDFASVLIETVGVGQDGIDIREVCDTTVVVQSPHTGDVVQSMKAGILEIADIYAVTKADLPGAHHLVRDLNAMVHLSAQDAAGWQPPVLAVSATDNTGFQELAGAITRHANERTPESTEMRAFKRLRWEAEKRANVCVRAAATEMELGTLGRIERVQAVLSQALADSGKPYSRSGRP